MATRWGILGREFFGGMLVAAVCWWATAPVHAAQQDIHGPPGSVNFGSWVEVLPNGNIVVGDPNFSTPGAVGAGAVRLYTSSGSLISTLTGSHTSDHVGGIYVLADGNFVVASSGWSDGTNCCVGAVTWVDGNAGLSGVVSAENSLVGSTGLDEVGQSIRPLSDGSYVASSPAWSNGTASNAGAVTLISARTGRVGVVSAANSLVGTTHNDQVGGFGGPAVLANGNYVVTSRNWNNGAVVKAGAVTWVNGKSGLSGAVTAANSLVGVRSDWVGSAGVIRLANSNFLVVSPAWNSGAGAVTWGDGRIGLTGTITPLNSLVGSTPGDGVGSGGGARLTNGNYVIASPFWSNGTTLQVGAVTSVNSNTGRSGAVAPSNSLIGTSVDDHVGGSGVTALINGNYVVASSDWNSAGATQVGAVTWLDGNTSTSGVVALANSLVGTTTGDQIGIMGVTALTNGNYVVQSPNWHNGATANAGAATWVGGGASMSGVVSSNNSLVGTQLNDQVGMWVTALRNGNYVVASPSWNNGAASVAGAVTWGNGAAGVFGPVAVTNSLVGTTQNDRIGGYSAVSALVNGNYLVGSPEWNNGAAMRAGAMTWVNGSTGMTGAVSTSNSLVGTQAGDTVDGGWDLGDGNYVAGSQNWNNGAIVQAGAITLASGRYGLHGTIQPWNSVIGMAPNGGPHMPTVYDAARQRLIVGRPFENIVSVITVEQIFASAFE